MHVYKELKRKVGFEEYWRYVKDPLLVCSGTHELFEELDRHAKRGRAQECPHSGACKELVEHVLFECALYDSQRQTF